MIKTKAFDSLGHSRLVALIKDGLIIKTMDHWMDDKISSIWLKISGRGYKTLHIAAIYREHIY